MAGTPSGSPPADWDTIEAIEAYAAERGLTMLQVAIGGLAAQPAVTSVIAGATTPEQVHANAAAGTWEPSDDDLDALRRPPLTASGRPRRRVQPVGTRAG